MRLLPWTGEGGRPAYLSSADNRSFLSLWADDLEARQLGMAKSLQSFVDTTLDKGKPSETELRSMVTQLNHALLDTRRVAESRGRRLAAQHNGTKTAGRLDDTLMVDSPCALDEGNSVVRRWPNEPEYVGSARQMLRLDLNRWGMEPLVDTAVLVLSELFGNAVRHAPGCEDSLIETRFERSSNGTLRIEVHDAEENKPQRRDVSPDAEAGRGLALVDALTNGRWGVGNRVGLGKCVWALCGGDGPEGGHSLERMPCTERTHLLGEEADATS